MLIGCHVSIAGGIKNAPKRAADLGCETMQIFTRSPRGGKSSDLNEETINDFKKECQKNKIQSFVVHCPYYINLASANNKVRYGSVSAIREELERANSIGAKFVMTHLGSSGDIERKDSIIKIAEMLKKSLAGYEGETKLLLENSAGAGNIIGDDLSEISEIIKKVSSNKIAGICLDTQHSFASGYDWNNFKETLEKIDREIGIENIKLFHINDSKTELGSKKDRHEHIGKGLIGENAFKNIVNFAKEKSVDMICETEYDFVKEDIALLKKMREN